VTLAVAFVAVSVFAGGEGAEEAQPVRVPMQPYRTLPAMAVYRAAGEGIQAPVRFRDTYSGSFSVADSLPDLDLGGRTYQTAVAFRTGANLICLVPRSNAEALRVIFGSGGAQRPVVGAGQQLVIEGRLPGGRRLQRYVLVDALSTGRTIRANTRRELRVSLPGKQTAALIQDPGTQTLRFPCSHQEGQMEALEVTVNPMSAQAALVAAAELAGQFHGLDGAKVYGDYGPGTVYRNLRDPGVLNVRFTDDVIRVGRRLVPSGLRSVRLPVGNRTVRVPIAYAFETSQHLLCLVPDVWPTLVQQANRLLSGEVVRVQGSTLADAEAVVVDYMDFPLEWEIAGESSNWWVTLQLGEEGSRRVFWDVGSYAFPEMRCRYAQGYEPIRAVMAQYRLVQR
jgi:hypothetical protein